MADIQIESPTTLDIYSFGFDKNLNRSFPIQLSSIVYGIVNGAVNTGQIVSGGNLNVSKLGVGIGTLGSGAQFIVRGGDVAQALRIEHDPGSQGLYILAINVPTTDVVQIKDELGGARFFINSAYRVGIGTGTPATSALLELASTIGALLITRMTTTQRDALTGVNGMLIYNSTLGKFQGYEAGVWTNLI